MRHINSNRIYYLDYLKAFAIFTVILGHSIQNFKGSALMGSLYNFIYSFHMPLFMIISGYFFEKSLQANIFAVVMKKTRELILPVLSFSVVAFVVTWVTPFDITRTDNFLKYFFGGDMWFLKFLFACTVMACVSKLLFRKISIAGILPPAVLPIVSRVGMFRMFPYLWVGYCLNRYQKSVDRHQTLAIAVLWAMFVALLCFWKLEYNYPTYKIISLKYGFSFNGANMLIVAYRFLIGIVGSAAFIVTFKKMRLERLDKKLCFAKIGQHTLGMYCLQIYLLEYASDYVTLPDMPGWEANIAILVIAVAEFFLCNYIVTLLLKNKYTATLFLGKKFVK